MTSKLVNAKTETNIKLPLSFIMCGLLSFIASQYIFFINSDSLTIGAFRSPQILMGAHFLLLGFIIMVIMGAMYQLIPVVCLTPVWSERLGFIQLFITSTGIALFSILLGFQTNQAFWGALFLLFGIFLFFIQMFLTIYKQQKKNTLTLFIGSALGCFFLTVLAGGILSWSLANSLSINYSALLQSHIILGVAGWFTLLIFGFSYKLVPMFSLSHGFSMRWAKLCFCFYLFGLLCLILSSWLQVSMLQLLGLLFLLVGFSLFVLDMREIINKRLKKRLDIPFRFALFAIGFGWLVHVIAFTFKLLDYTNYRIWGWLVFSYISCWVIFSILGYLYKIVPFLWWTSKYSTKIGKKDVPTLKEMVNEKHGLLLFLAIAISSIGVIISGVNQVEGTFLLFQGMMLICSLLYGFSIVQVLLK